MNLFDSIFGRVPRCSRCGHPVIKTHRFRVVHHRFLFFRWDTIEHRSCHHPQMNPEVTFRPKPIPGREFCDLFGPSEEELARSIYEDGK